MLEPNPSGEFGEWTEVDAAFHNPLPYLLLVRRKPITREHMESDYNGSEQRTKKERPKAGNNNLQQ